MYTDRATSSRCLKISWRQNRRQVISNHQADSLHKYHVTTIKQTISEGGCEVGNPLVSLLWTSPSFHDDNASCPVPEVLHVLNLFLFLLLLFRLLLGLNVTTQHVDGERQHPQGHHWRHGTRHQDHRALATHTVCNGGTHDDVIKWKHFPRYWPFVRGIHRPPVNSPHKGQCCGALMFSLICSWTNVWVYNRETGDLRRNRAHYDVTVMRGSTIRTVFQYREYEHD